VASVAAIWLCLLPQLSRKPRVAQHLAKQREAGIDPSAMFYTELEIMPAIAHRMERRRLRARTTAPSE
jgi:hypothetical protein